MQPQKSKTVGLFQPGGAAPQLQGTGFDPDFGCCQQL